LCLDFSDFSGSLRFLRFLQLHRQRLTPHNNGRLFDVSVRRCDPGIHRLTSAGRVVRRRDEERRRVSGVGGVGVESASEKFDAKIAKNRDFVSFLGFYSLFSSYCHNLQLH